MRYHSILAAAVLLAGCTPAARQDHSQSQAEAELRAANSRYDNALVAGNAAVLDQMYTADFQIIDDDANVSGKNEQIRFITREVDLLDARSDDVRTTMLGPDSALMTGRFTGRYRFKGEERDFVERYTAVWVREEGRWKLKHEHSSIQPEEVPQQDS